MTIETPEMTSQVAQLTDRDARQDLANSVRLDNWRRRYPHRTIEVPKPIDPPKWPASRSNIAEPEKVVKIKTRART